MATSDPFGPDPTGGLRRRVPLLLPSPEASGDASAAAEPRRLAVGLLGGSFNPAHEGHLAVSLEVMKRLGLDQVWWLVSPQNPLKARAGMAKLQERMATARQVARHPRIKVLDLESRLGTRYTIDLLRRLAGWRDHRFTFLMGSDNLQQLPRWRHWTMIAEQAGIAVVERQPYCYAALRGAAGVRLAGARVRQEDAQQAMLSPPPVWTFLRMRPHPASSTAIRRARAQGSSGAPAADRESA